ncbi:DUF2284 domain-containing protein [Neomoorella thermoacetica]|uniref:DUF2284 domain-containing protein n=1 Tax=Neomoorella thermoacetica TaxID=1525 RepID=UPI0008FB36A9|nr:DUF2284 domain-containing protein [Moorella thermoacetica]OIQ59713.1 multifunctional cyclase-dehydratase-3-O-methyl transferase TcmN [Moorella thermoacetica]
MKPGFLKYDPQAPCPQYLEDLATGYWFSEVLFTAVEAGLFTLLAGGGMSAAEIAEALGFSIHGTERFLEALCALGLIGRDGDVFFNTRLSETYLVRGREHYQGDSILWRKHLASSWRGLKECLEAGGRVSYPPPGESRECMGQRVGRYIRAMDNVARYKVQEILPIFEGVFDTGRVLDVGSGSGAVAAGFLEQYPGLAATLVDIPEVLELTKMLMEERGLGGRVTCHPANILEPGALPQGPFDLVILSNILHIYTEKEGALLLSRAAGCLGAAGFLLVHDFFPEHRPEKAALMDLNMLINTYNGKVLSSRWVRERLEARGLCSTELVPLRSDTALVIAARDAGALEKLKLAPEQRLAARIMSLGFRGVCPISAADIYVSDWVELRCRYGCENYGRPHCPPNSPPPEKTRAVLKDFSVALLLEGEPPARDFQLRVLAAEREAFKAGYYKATAFWAGPCALCPSCSAAEQCRHPRDARPSMEGSGIDVYETVRRAGRSLRTLQDRQDYVKYFALLLLE